MVGSGHMGTAIAASLLQHGLRVLLVDKEPRALDKARDRLSNTLEEQAGDQLEVTTELDRVSSAGIAFETVPEDLAIKQEVVKELEGYVSDNCLIATNTSGLSIARIAESLTLKHRLVGTHFFTPADVIPLVEVVRGPETSDETVEAVSALLRSVGKRPVTVEKDVPGFVANRIQHAMAREAMSLVEKGVASPEDIDDIVRWSIGVRLALIGPLEQRDLNGLDVHLHIASYLYTDLENSEEPLALLREKVDRGELGLESGSGFYDWSRLKADDVQHETERAVRKLVEWLKANKLREDRPDDPHN